MRDIGEFSCILNTYPLLGCKPEKESHCAKPGLEQKFLHLSGHDPDFPIYVPCTSRSIFSLVFQ